MQSRLLGHHITFAINKEDEKTILTCGMQAYKHLLSIHMLLNHHSTPASDDQNNWGKDHFNLWYASMHSFALNSQALGTPQHVCSYHTSNTLTIVICKHALLCSQFTGSWDTTARLFLPYFQYQDTAGNFGINDVELSLHLGYETYIDNRLGEVSCFVLSTKQAWWGRVQAPGRVGLACCAKDVCLGFCFLPLSRDFAVSPLTYKSRQNQNHVSRRASWTTYKGGGVRALSGCAS